MGASSVNLAYTYWSHLPDAAFRALVWMCIQSIDQDRPPRYFGGRAALARAIGREPAGGGHLTTADRQAVTRALRTLRSAGVITPTNSPRPGQSAEYALHLSPQAHDPVDNSLSTGAHMVNGYHPVIPKTARMGITQ